MSFLSHPELPLWADRSPAAALTVAQLTRHVVNLISADVILQDVWVRGELSNVTYHGSGHVYFGMKDEDACLRCVMFRNDARLLRFTLEAGRQVVAHGHLGVYEKRGDYQFIVDAAEPDGVGALYLAFEQLRTRLETEGLFAIERKRPLPSFPRRVAVVTSPTGAAIHDICSIIGRRCPAATVVIVPALVQGDGAPSSICEAIAAANAAAEADLVVLARGGGSIEDLWAFNDESVARAIVASRLPVVSAVGHETDVTIADFVADLRAPTPSAAAELIVPDLEELRRGADVVRERLAQAMRYYLGSGRDRLRIVRSYRAFTRPFEELHRRRQEIDDLDDRLRTALTHRLQRERLAMGGLAGRLQALGPLATLSRGFAIVTRLPKGKIVRSASEVVPGDSIRVYTGDGAFAAQVTSIEEETR